jgi:hypothetical protein
MVGSRGRVSVVLKVSVVLRTSVVIRTLVVLILLRDSSRIMGRSSMGRRRSRRGRDRGFIRLVGGWGDWFFLLLEGMGLR